MKAILIIFALSCSLVSIAETVPLRIEDVASKVSKDNFMVLENAERVYQRKEKIKFSRAGLLPKLNIWNLLKIPALIIDPLAIGDIIQDVAPFLVPANWFKVGQAKHLYKSQQEQYRALWANEVNTAKLLFTSVYRDIKLQELIASKSTQYKGLMDIAESRNIFGEGNIFAYNLIKDRHLALVEDTRNLKNLTFNESKELQYLTGIGNELDIKIVPPVLPKLGEAEKIEFSKIVFKVIEASPEAKQFEHMFNALGKVKGEIFFNILGSSTYSAENGAFDNIPIQDGLGFGLGPSLRISKSEGRILKIQLKATVETLKRQVNALVNEHNSLIENFDITKQRIALAEANYQAMVDHISIGGEIDALEMTEILDNLYASKVLLLSYEFRYSDLVEKLKRMTFSGDYANDPNNLEDVVDVKAKDAAIFMKGIQTKLKNYKAEVTSLNLKSYSDSLATAATYFTELVKKKSDRRRLKKYLSRNNMEAKFCEKVFLNENEFLDIQEECLTGKFNTCPLTFVKYHELKKKIIGNLKSLYDSSTFSNTNCEIFNN
ncbi:MAG: hypothetical protein ACJAT2_002342 [Bacteriovoracaceae bacterium]|jgi:hypothetical protein